MSSSKVPVCLNKLSVSGRLWLAADIHLGAHNPATSQAFYQFLQQAHARCDVLILCGDIFNAWIGDDQIQDVRVRASQPWLVQAMQALQTFARSKSLYLMRGNRDFLLGQRFARAVGATLLPDALRVHTASGEFWLTHGDELCTEDLNYQRLRRWVRKPVMQRLFLACPLRWRHTMADWLRRRSQRAGGRKNPQISDVNLDACQHLLARQALSILVHGHTHRPAVHHHHNCWRVVLPDWELDNVQPPRQGWLSVDENGFALHQPDRVQVFFGSAGVPAVPACASARTVGIVLAAGLSRRMGEQNKLQLPVRDQPMIRVVVEQVLQACEQVIVVLGHEATAVQAALQNLPVTFVHNPDYANGIGSSVSMGAQAVPAGHAALVCLGDMPGVGSEVMRALVQAGQARVATGIAACQPVSRQNTQQRGNPVWWAASQIAHLQILDGDSGARVRLQALRTQGRVVDVLVEENGILRDIDTPQDWQAFLRSSVAQGNSSSASIGA